MDHPAPCARAEPQRLQPYTVLPRRASILVKNEIFFDRYDLAFLDTFKDIETTDEMLEKIIEGLKKVKELKLSEDRSADTRNSISMRCCAISRSSSARGILRTMLEATAP
jgi:hypothetical protein